MIDPKAIEEGVDRYRRLLRTAIRAAGLNVAEVERRLSVRPRTLQRILVGRFDLKLRHILEVLAVLGLEEEEFFRTATGRRAGAGAVVELVGGLGYRGRAQLLEDAKVSAEDFQRMVDEAVEQTLTRLGKEGWPVRPEAEPGPEPEAPEASTRERERKAPPAGAPRGKKPKR